MLSKPNARNCERKRSNERNKWAEGDKFVDPRKRTVEHEPESCIGPQTHKTTRESNQDLRLLDMLLASIFRCGKAIPGFQIG